VQYSLTPAGVELIGVLDELERWERRYAGSGPGRPSR
jgi:DNA-binding HxlR family transcriptional regulator